MIVAFLSVNSQFTVFLLLSTYQSKKIIFHSHVQDITRKYTRQFLSKFSAFLEIWAAFLESPGNLFGPVKPFIVHLYLNKEECMRLKLLV